MAEACCNQHKINHKQHNNLLIRTILLVVIGVLTLIPFVETLLATGVMGLVGFGVISVVIGYSLYKDFSDYQYFNLGMLAVISVGIAIPFVSSFAVQAMLLSFSLLIGSILLFVNDQMWAYWFKNKDGSVERPKQILVIPSVNKAILFLSNLSWVISLGSYFRVARGIYHFVIHDVLLTLGVHNFGTWVKQSMHSHTLEHNHHGINVQVSTADGAWVKKSITKLKKGDKIRVSNPTLIPVPSMVINEAKVFVPADESDQVFKAGDLLKVDAEVVNGEIECTEDFDHIQAEQKSKVIEPEDRKLQVFLMLSFMVAAVGAVIAGMVFSSVLIGLQTFCYNLMVSCPCAFLVAKPIVHNKFKDWVQGRRGIHVNKMPASGLPHIMVFDRTGTLYVPDRDNLEGAYVLAEGAKEMLEGLKALGIRIIILSGHGAIKGIDNGSEQHKQQCINDLKGIVDTKDIIFDRKYHNETGKEVAWHAKAEVISNLKRYGSVDAPKKQGLGVKISSFFKGIFSANTVAMVGDADNDVAAMAKADLAIGVSKNVRQRPGNTAEQSHFFVEHKSFKKVPELLKKVKASNRYINGLIALSVVCNLTLLALVNGLFFAMFGFAFPSAAICLSTVAVCLLILGVTALIKFGKKQPVDDHNGCCGTPLSASELEHHCHDGYCVAPETGTNLVKPESTRQGLLGHKMPEQCVVASNKDDKKQPVDDKPKSRRIRPYQGLLGHKRPTQCVVASNKDDSEKCMTVMSQTSPSPQESKCCSGECSEEVYARVAGSLRG